MDRVLDTSHAIDGAGDRGRDLSATELGMPTQPPTGSEMDAISAFLLDLQARFPMQAGRDYVASLRGAPAPLRVGGNAWAVTGWIEVLDVLTRTEDFRVPYAPNMDPSVGPFMLARDDAIENWRDKAVMRALLRLDDGDAAEDCARDAADDALSRASGGRVDLVETVARIVPLRVVQRVFGFPGPSDCEMLRWSLATQHAMFRNTLQDPLVASAGIDAGLAMRAWIRGFMAARQPWSAITADDVVSRLLRMSAAGLSGLDPEMVATNICGLLVGAIETSAQAIVYATYEILSRADVRAKAIAAMEAGDTPVRDGLVREALRFRPVTPVLIRHCPAPTVLAPGTARQTLVDANSLVLAVTGAATFDEAIFPNPNAFLVRPGAPSLAYGFGAHECLGRHVADRVVPETVGRILKLPGIRLQPGDPGDFGMRPEHPFPRAFIVEFDR